MAYIDDLVISADNLAEVASAVGISAELRNVHVRELAHAVAGLCDFSLRRISDSIRNSQSPVSAPYLSLSISERALFWAELSKILKKAPLGRIYLPEEFSDFQEAIPPEATEKISYLKSNYADAAYFKFSSVISTPRASYAESFENACEDVYNGICEFCILPIENSTDGKLIGFFSLIEKYELKISTVCTVHYADNSRNTKFALLRKNITTQFAAKSKEIFLELGITVGAGISLSSILSVADIFGFKFYRMDGITITHEKKP